MLISEINIMEMVYDINEYQQAQSAKWVFLCYICTRKSRYFISETGKNIEEKAVAV